jgi:D-alanyl-lipoteichoic acid acyltransferase DltB (MBOAT superfamily)
MNFVSIDFAIFLPIVFCLYWLVLKFDFKFQNALLLAASYVFYGCWDWRFLTLIFASSLVDWNIGLALEKNSNDKQRKWLLIASLVFNLGLLAFFKYFNFFLDSFVDSFQFFGQDLNVNRLNIILPVGISFYTFQTLSYTIDIYRNKIKACHDPIAFFAFVSFFPQLVAGPIERASNLLPQFLQKRNFDYDNAVDGLRQILWGLFKKVVIADNCAFFVDMIFANSTDYSGSTLLLGAILFSFQIYGDFSGYSDIAIGTSRLFGIKLMKNFAFPYFSRDIAEFWRRWHISLSTWFRDYLYIPLGGSRGGTWLNIRNVFIVFIVSGFWHGANWTFVFWGALNALYFLPLLLLKKNRTHLGEIAPNRTLPSFKVLLQIGLTFSITVFAWIFFRAESLEHAFQYISDLFSSSLFSVPNISGKQKLLMLGLFMIGFISLEWNGRQDEYAIEKFALKWTKPLRWVFYYLIGFIVYYHSGAEVDFIYFQF